MDIRTLKNDTDWQIMFMFLHYRNLCRDIQNHNFNRIDINNIISLYGDEINQISEEFRIITLAFDEQSYNKYMMLQSKIYPITQHCENLRKELMRNVLE